MSTKSGAWGAVLCEYNCAFANSGCADMVKALKDRPIYPRIRVEGDDRITYAVSVPPLRRTAVHQKLHLRRAAPATHPAQSASITSKCVGCLTCVLVCPYGAVAPDGNGVVQKCELCLTNASGTPACVAGCPNGAIVYEER